MVIGSGSYLSELFEAREVVLGSYLSVLFQAGEVVFVLAWGGGACEVGSGSYLSVLFQAGEVVLGGCSPKPEKHQCHDCKHQF